MIKQKPIDDIFITKYPDNEEVSNIILDFDGADHKEKVYSEVTTIQRFLKHKGVNSVIVSSTNKGFHFYVQIPTLHFDKEHLELDRKERNRVFVMFTQNLINYQQFKFQTLDPTNTNAGLGGNIRLLGSIHPKTQETVSILQGEFIDMEDYGKREEYLERCSHYVNTIYRSTINQYHVHKEYHEQELHRKQVKLNRKGLRDPIKENDLREIIPNLYGGKVKKYGDYIFMTCPWHTDRNPSLKVTKEWFYCTGCGEKGNIWKLIKSGEIKL